MLSTRIQRIIYNALREQEVDWNEANLEARVNTCIKSTNKWANVTYVTILTNLQSLQRKHLVSYTYEAGIGYTNIRRRSTEEYLSLKGIKIS